jgi:intron-binding protein aquarius
VHYLLERRTSLLEDVDRLAKSLNILGDHAYSCETACNFFRYHIQTRWIDYIQLKNDAELDRLKAMFPFWSYFTDVPGLFDNISSNNDFWSTAEGGYHHIVLIFQELEEIRPLEILKSNYERANYVLAKEAKIVAMTCTHAALKRRELLNLNLRYETVIFEEAAQMQEIESFVPLMLQNPVDLYYNTGEHPLKRIVMIGDHHQLSPIIQNESLQKHCNLEQSMFLRFIRLGVPYVELNAQGRARSSIVDLYRWRYKELIDLPFILSDNSFKQANSGFAFEYQLIDVLDYLGKGETQPMPHFYQNLGEAEYVVATYQFMRLVGYPAEKITILTTYNGQKCLIREVLEHRCSSWHSFFGRPRITTVDTYQGQQNDYILLSLVRTKSIGHLRDVRRLIVAMSRARLGLYIFCRASLFSQCLELMRTFKPLLERPTKLHLILGESIPCPRMIDDHHHTYSPFILEDVVHMGQFIIKMIQEHTERLQAQSQYITSVSKNTQNNNDIMLEEADDDDES